MTQTQTMSRDLVIAEAHSQHKPEQRVVLPMYGGDPWYCFVWINDECFTIYLKKRGRPVLEKTQ